MNLSTICRPLFRTASAAAALAAFALLAGCEKIWDPEGDCSRHYQVSFTHLRNMLDADAFAERVHSLSLFVFDQNGKLVATQSAAGELLRSDRFVMTFDNLEPATYDLIAWGGLADGDAFALANPENPLSKEDLICRMTRQHDDQGNAFSDRKLNDLFFGARQIIFPNAYGEVPVGAVDLMKDTNTLRVAIHQKNGRKLEADRFSFRLIENNGNAGNGLLNYDNSLLDDEPIVYREWTKKEQTLENPENSASRAGDYATDGTITAVVAEISLGRLLASHDPVLVVEYEGRQEQVVNLHLLELLEIAKGVDRESMAFQDYLDREDEYTMYFNVEDDNSWYMQGGIIINGWKVVFQDSNM